MKTKIIITCAAMLTIACTNSAFAQPNWLYNPGGDIRTNSNTTEVVIDGNSKLGINTTQPLNAGLTINGEVDFQDNFPGWPTYRHIRAHNREKGLAILAKSGWSDGAGILLNGNENSNGEGDVTISAGEGQSGNGGAMSFTRWSGGPNGSWTTNMLLNKDGALNVRDDISLSGDAIRYNQHGGAGTPWNKYLIGNTNESFAIFGNDENWTNSSGIVLNSPYHSTEQGSVTLVASGNTGASDAAFNFVLADNNGWHGKMHLNKGGDLDIAGSTIQYGPNASWNRYLLGNTSTSFAMFANNGWSSGAGIMLNGNSGGSAGDVHIVAGNGNSGSGIINFARWNGNGWTPNMIIDQNGKISIGGVSTPGSYRLYVKDGILTEKVKVALSNDPNNWADYVFADDYKLRPLGEVENYIKENKHLPEIPSTEEVHKEGLDLAQMDAKLLKKIEELTLYVIQQQKEIDRLKKGLHK